VSPPHHLYLVPGFFGFETLGELAYFGHVVPLLEAACAEQGLDAAVHVVATEPTSSLPRRAARLLAVIAETAGDDGPIHLVGHSSGGLDARLLVAPGVALPGAPDVEAIARRVASVVTVSTPHHGTPLAAFATGLLGQRLLRIASLATIYVLRFGHLPLSVLLRLGGFLARIDRRVGLNSALLDELFGQLLEDFSRERRLEVEAFLDQVGNDAALILQLTPDGMEVFNAATRDRPSVRYGSVVTQAQAPGVASTLAAGLDPSAQATHALYAALYRLAGISRRGRLPTLERAQAQALRRAYGHAPGGRANDGIVPTLSQPWGDLVHAARADHLDIVGHFADAEHVPPHFDWLATGSHFDRRRFEAAWRAVARWLGNGAEAGVRPAGRRRGSRATSPAGPSS
jgi:triacylglycerol esterase/lipase EstA (alpha/beta hydrolase family)